MKGDVFVLVIFELVEMIVEAVFKNSGVFEFFNYKKQIM